LKEGKGSTSQSTDNDEKSDTNKDRIDKEKDTNKNKYMEGQQSYPKPKMCAGAKLDMNMEKHRYGDEY